MRSIRKIRAGVTVVLSAGRAAFVLAAGRVVLMLSAGRAAFVLAAGKAALAACGAILLTTACSTMQDSVDAARTKIIAYLTGSKIFDRNNPPESTENITGFYDVVDGAFRYIENEDREDRDLQPEIVQGSLIEFMFDARIFSSNYVNSNTFYTNSVARIAEIAVGNNEFNTEFWPTVPLEVRIGEGTILKSLENALLSCREGDEMQILLTPDIGFGDRAVGIVPARSTLIYGITDIRVLE